MGVPLALGVGVDGELVKLLEGLGVVDLQKVGGDLCRERLGILAVGAATGVNGL